jgi:hypothetical protein
MLRFPCVDFEFSITCGLLYVEAGLILSNRSKSSRFLGSYCSLAVVPEPAHQVFGEMPVRI